MSIQLMVDPPASQQTHQQEGLTEAQSLALVKIFLNSSLACICHTRELIDWQSDCFRTRFIDQIDLTIDNAYHGFCDKDPTNPGASQEVRVLVRSGTIQGNSILNMIEHGVFEAIEKAYLDTLQVFVTTEAEDSHNIRETYTYSFSYFGNAVVSVELKEQQQYLTLSDAQRSLKAAIRCLLRAMKDLPRLPTKRSLGMSIAYNDNCPDAYNPAGFVDAKTHKIVKSDWDRMWTNTGHPVSKFDASHHAVDITARNSTFGYQTASQIQDTVISKQLQNLQKTSSAGHTGIVSTLPAPVSPIHSAMPRRGSSREVVRSSPLSTRVTKSRKAKAKSMTRSKSQASSVTTKRNAASTKKNPLNGLAILATSRRRRDILASKMAEVIVQARCLDFEAQNGGTIFDPDLLAKGSIVRIEAGEAVKCECGNEEPSESMILCNLCNSWQHCQCYGLTLTTRQKSKPSQHLCYSCLLLPKEEKLLSSVIDLVRMRLALMHISGMPTARLDLDDLTKKVFGSADADGEQRTRLINQLVAEQVISQTTKGVALVNLVPPDRVRKLQTEYLDPLAAISHHYRTVKDADTEEGRAQELESEIRRYTEGRDYGRGIGVEDVIVADSSGDPAVRWGYYNDGINLETATAPAWTPSSHRRRVSVSRAFINLDRSTPASSGAFDEDESSYSTESGQPTT